MKNTFIGLAVAIAGFSSCSKENTDPANINNTEPVIVKYEFTSNTPDAYKFSYKKDTSYLYENIHTQTWSKTVSATRNSHSNMAKLTVLPPEAWFGTDTQATVNLKISVDGVVKKDSSAIMQNMDREAGITIQATY